MTFSASERQKRLKTTTACTFSTCSLPKVVRDPSFLHFWLGNVLRTTTACTFSTSHLPKVVRSWRALYILTWKCASHHSGVHFFDISSSKSGPELTCFVHFELETCFAPQRRTLFRHLHFQKWSEHGVLCTFWLGNLLCTTAACTFSTSHLPKVVRSWRALYILSWKRASRPYGWDTPSPVLAGRPMPESKSKPPQSTWLGVPGYNFKTGSFSSHAWAKMATKLDLPTSAYPSVHIVGSLTSKLPSIIWLIAFAIIWIYHELTALDYSWWHNLAHLLTSFRLEAGSSISSWRKMIVAKARGQMRKALLHPAEWQSLMKCDHAGTNRSASSRWSHQNVPKLSLVYVSNLSRKSLKHLVHPCTFSTADANDCRMVSAQSQANSQAATKGWPSKEQSKGLAQALLQVLQRQVMLHLSLGWQEALHPLSHKIYVRMCQSICRSPRKENLGWIWNPNFKLWIRILAGAEPAIAMPQGSCYRNPLPEDCWAAPAISLLHHPTASAPSARQPASIKHVHRRTEKG